MCELLNDVRILMGKLAYLASAHTLVHPPFPAHIEFGSLH